MAAGWADMATSAALSDSRATINTGFTELTNLHAGTTAPSNLVDGMLWFDTTSNQVKFYDAGNTAWRVIIKDTEADQGGIAHLDASTFTAAVGYDGSAAATADNNFPKASQIGSMVFSSMHEITFANASGNHLIWTVPVSARYEVSDVYIISDTATTSSDGTDNWTFQVVNLTETEDLIATAATTNGAEIAADTRYALGVDQNNVKANLDAGDVLELQITKNGTPTDLSSANVLVQIDYKMDLF